MFSVFYIFIAAIIFIFGTAIGSFISATVYRMHKKETMLGRSYCPRCGYKLGFFDLFPIFSFLYLHGKCRKCKSKIDVEYFLTEIISGAVFVFSFFYRWLNIDAEEMLVWTILRDWLFLGGLIFLFIYDFKYRILPDKITFPLISAMLIFNFFLEENFKDILIGIAVGAGFFLIQYLISRGKWVGDGDIRMGALLGAALGWPNVVFALFVAYILGSAATVPLVLMKKKKLKSQIAFGTFLAIGGFTAMYWGNDIMNWYLSFF